MRQYHTHININLDGWNESDHPRDDEGKFSSSGGEENSEEHEELFSFARSLIKQAEAAKPPSVVGKSQMAVNVRPDKRTQPMSSREKADFERRTHGLYKFSNFKLDL